MPSQTLVATLECAGNGRSMFEPQVDGEQWRLGAVSTAEWTGVPLVEVLERARATARRRRDDRLARRRQRHRRRVAIRFTSSAASRSTRSAVSDAVLAYAMNGDPLPLQHGYPLRVIVPGWYAVDLGEVAHRHRGDGDAVRRLLPDSSATCTSGSNRTARRSIEPVRLQQVRSIITEPAADATVPLGDVVIRGVAWSGAAPIAGVEVSIGGRTLAAGPDGR